MTTKTNTSQSEKIYIVAEPDDNYPYGLYLYCAHLSKEAADLHVNMLTIKHKDKNTIPQFVIFGLELIRDRAVINFLKEKTHA